MRSLPAFPLLEANHKSKSVGIEAGALGLVAFSCSFWPDHARTGSGIVPRVLVAMFFGGRALRVAFLRPCGAEIIQGEVDSMGSVSLRPWLCSLSPLG